MDEFADAPGNPVAVRVHQFETESASVYADLISIWHDLHFVASACVRLQSEFAKSVDERDGIVIRSLWSAILAAYARCFISGKRKRLSTSDVGSLPLEGEVLEWHQWLIDMRNKHVAHSVNGFESVRVGVSLDPETGAVDGVVHMSMLHVVTDEGGVEQTRMLAFELGKLLSSRIQKQEEVVRREAATLGPAHISQFASVGAVVPGPEEAGKARS